MTILVTGARGNVGRLVVDGLLAAGRPVRAAGRDPQAAGFPDGVEVVRADLTDLDSLPAALDGVDQVFLYASEAQPEPLAAALREGGVAHVVLLSSASVLYPDADDNPIARRHADLERALDDAALACTFVRPGAFAVNALRWQSIRTERVMRTAFPDSTVSPVHERDIAEVAVRALLDEAYRGAAPAVLGPGPMTQREQVAAIADALGEPVRVEVVDEDAYRQELLARLPPFVADRLIEAREQLPDLPAGAPVDAVPEVLGRPALGFDVWARDHVADFR